MEQYISKAAILAEIEKRKKEWSYGSSTEAKYKVEAYKELTEWLDSLEVKEVDLEKEIDRVWDNTSDNFSEDGWKEFEDIAKHFFELGVNASNPLTWEDMLIIHKCIKDAMNYHLYAFQSADGQQKVYEEVLKRFKEKKGE